MILELGLQKGLQKGVTLDGERGYKKWKWGGGWRGGKSTHFFGLTPDFGR